MKNKKEKNNQLVKEKKDRELIVSRQAGFEPNEYYIEVAGKFKIAKMMTLICLIAFVLGMIAFFRNDITLENCRYFIRYFDVTSTKYSGDYRSIYFDASGTTDIDFFHGDLVTIKRNSVNLYNLEGNNTLSYNANYNNPVVITSGKYMLVYDLNGVRFDLFNNFSQLAGETYKYPISGAAVSKEGMYAIVGKTIDYQSVVYLYDHNFKLISRIYKDKYVTDCKITDKGDELIILSVYATGGEYCTEIMICKPYSDTPKGTNNLNGVMAIKAGYHTDGSYTILTDKGLLFFDSDDNQISSFSFGSIVPTKCMIEDNYTIITYNENIIGSDTAVLIFSPKGEQLMKTLIEEKILDITNYGDNLYMLFNGSLSWLDINSGEIKNCSFKKGSTRIFIYDESTALIGYSNMAKTYSLNDLFKNG